MPETQDTCPTSPVPPPVRQTPMRVKELQAPQQQHSLHDLMEVLPSKEKPLLLRRRSRKRPHEDSASDPEGAATDVVVPVAMLWFKQASSATANSYNVQLETDGTMEQGMDTLQLTLPSRPEACGLLLASGRPQ
ncbi:uncharacterized protein LOC144141739 [Haemaphysalis longicornis]